MLRSIRSTDVDSSVLCHHGIKGQKWGVRRYQNPDGTWTNEGRERYGIQSTNQKSKADNTAQKNFERSYDESKRGSHHSADETIAYASKQTNNIINTYKAVDRGMKVISKLAVDIPLAAQTLATGSPLGIAGMAAIGAIEAGGYLMTAINNISKMNSERRKFNKTR